ncbi:hypothetical protein P3W85_28555 [Cupriavidus basilensis]|uniref:Uncharacterized protein n=1 Tax=Cupriavidus basilensis TaxID=68895 RepID=A0ABT6AW66_9BURK|nr:hypothetical protein [Cupriavidus basilensis]
MQRALSLISERDAKAIKDGVSIYRIGVARVKSICYPASAGHHCSTRLRCPPWTAAI